MTSTILDIIKQVFGGTYIYISMEYKHKRGTAELFYSYSPDNIL